MDHSPVPHILILEPDWRGHAREWLEHIVAAGRAHPRAIKFSFAVAPELAQAFAGMSLQGTALSLNVFPLTRSETKYCLSRVLSASGMARWWLMRRYLALSGADHGVFLSIDHASLPLALGLPLGEKTKTVSGILFRPSQHYRFLGHFHPNWRERFRDIRKDVLYWRMLINPAVASVLTLDPYFRQYARARYCHGEKLDTIADPANPAVPEPAKDTTLAGRIPNDGRTVFLLFGDLTERKGILVFLEALRRLDPVTARSAVVIVAGRVDGAIRDRVRTAMTALAATRPELWLHLEERFLATGELAALVSRSDVVLAPYQRFVGSSGILMWAARTGKPVIAQDYGLLGQLVRDHGLGLAVDTTNPDVLADGIRQAVEKGAGTLIDSGKCEAFIRRRTPERFARALIHAALPPQARHEPYAQSVRASSDAPK